MVIGYAYLYKTTTKDFYFAFISVTPLLWIT